MGLSDGGGVIVACFDACWVVSCVLLVVVFNLD